MLTIGIGLFAVGFVLLGLTTITFKVRAITNKPAWGGVTLPAGLVGVTLAIGITIIILNRG